MSMHDDAVSLKDMLNHTREAPELLNVAAVPPLQEAKNGPTVIA